MPVPASHLCCCFINEVNGLVWQLPVRQVCVRQRGCRCQRSICDAHTMVVLVPAGHTDRHSLTPHGCLTQCRACWKAYAFVLTATQTTNDPDLPLRHLTSSAVSHKGFHALLEDYPVRTLQCCWWLKYRCCWLHNSLVPQAPEYTDRLLHARSINRHQLQVNGTTIGLSFLSLCSFPDPPWGPAWARSCADTSLLHVLVAYP